MSRTIANTEPWEAVHMFPIYIRNIVLMNVNLFQVVDTRNEKVVKKDFGRNEKSKAKKVRDRLNERNKSTKRFVVRKGPDHCKYEN